MKRTSDDTAAHLFDLPAEFLTEILKHLFIYSRRNSLPEDLSFDTSISIADSMTVEATIRPYPYHDDVSNEKKAPYPFDEYPGTKLVMG